mmetsp:Transcript_19506/g.42397  ORF Transcript_19506/g.42397 Transcript_19506/m.42397 type:complete len:153 (+) Transcript_19506:121-579(+)
MIFGLFLLIILASLAPASIATPQQEVKVKLDMHEIQERKTRQVCSNHSALVSSNASPVLCISSEEEDEHETIGLLYDDVEMTHELWYKVRDSNGDLQHALSMVSSNHLSQDLPTIEIGNKRIEELLVYAFNGLILFVSWTKYMTLFEMIGVF